MLTDLAMEPRYSLAEAARLTQVPPATVRRWAHGYEHGKGTSYSEPVIRAPGGAALSFLDLIEVLVVRLMRNDYDWSLQRIRRFHHYLTQGLGLSHPFASSRLLTDGERLLVEHDEALVDASAHGQVAFRNIAELYLRQIDFRNDTASVWWMLGRDHAIAVDPAIGFGRPIVRDRGIATANVFELFAAGDPVDAIERELGLTHDQVLDALQAEARLRERAAA